jgi:hypothetical protein
MRLLFRVVASLMLASVAVGIPMAPPARASCAGDSGPEGSPIIFVGSAQEERRGYTRFSVAEIRSGPDLAPKVWVQSGQEQPPWPLHLIVGAVSASGDVQFQIGSPYVVGATQHFRTDSCSVEPAGPASDASRPDQVRSPVPDGRNGADPPLGALGTGLRVAALASLVGGALVLYRSRSRHAG